MSNSRKSNGVDAIRFLARLPLRSQGLKISGGNYYALEEDEDGFQYVKRYAVTWKVK